MTGLVVFAHGSSVAMANEAVMRVTERMAREGGYELVETAYAPGARMDELARSAGRTPMALYKSLHRIRMILADCVQLTLNQKEELA